MFITEEKSWLTDTEKNGSKKFAMHISYHKWYNKLYHTVNDEPGES
jgi:hypothetical protein